MAISFHAMSSGYYGTQSITSSTNVRDVSDMLDLWAHTETPFLNRLSWGPDSGGLIVEWISEHLGWGMVEVSTALATADTTGIFYAAHSASEIYDYRRGLMEGAMLYCYSSTDGEHGLLLIDSIAASGTATFAWMTTGLKASLAASAKLYIIGHFANEGSDPRTDSSRARAILSNKFTILRQDVNITGSEAATDMYAVGDELRHQIRNRLIELQREREMTCLYSVTQARSTTVASHIDGVFGFLKGQTGTHIDITTTDLTESKLNTVVRECWQNMGTPNVFVAHPDITSKFTSFDRARVRSAPDEKMGGLHIASYMTDIGLELDLLPMRKVPKNLAFVLNTSDIELRAKKGRKLLVEKLGKTGDYEMWQMLSEFSMVFRGYDKGKHGMFTRLAS